MSSNKKLYRLVLGAIFLALALVLPFLTMQIPKIGKMLCPMHLPVLLCGFLYGMGKIDFGWEMFLSGAFINAFPGIIVQIILIPILVIALLKYRESRE